jgi:hypothetical protein
MLTIVITVMVMGMGTTQTLRVTRGSITDLHFY